MSVVRRGSTYGIYYIRMMNVLPVVAVLCLPAITAIG